MQLVCREGLEPPTSQAGLWGLSRCSDRLSYPHEIVPDDIRAFLEFKGKLAQEERRTPGAAPLAKLAREPRGFRPRAPTEGFPLRKWLTGAPRHRRCPMAHQFEFTDADNRETADLTADLYDTLAGKRAMIGMSAALGVAAGIAHDGKMTLPTFLKNAEESYRRMFSIHAQAAAAAKAVVASAVDQAVDEALASPPGHRPRPRRCGKGPPKPPERGQA